VGQTCHLGTCREASADVDGDHILDVEDNCPDVANADQGNEDGDAFGDACDPCPSEANDTPDDPDGDGVSDSCDPHPSVTGDRILAFEGFHAGVPADWPVAGAVTPQGDEVVLEAAVGKTISIVAPVAVPANGKVSIGVVVDHVVGGSGDDTYVGPAMPYDPSGDVGIHCEMFDSDASDTAGRYLSFWDSVTGTEVGTPALDWVDGGSYVISLARSGAEYTCAGAPTGGAVVDARASPASVPPVQKVGMRAHSITTRLAWVLVIESP
jgi:hypothetical protein